MSLGVRVLYVDETRIDGSGPFYFGALDCSPRRAEILAEQLHAVRVKHQCGGEMKWEKVSTKMLPVYEDFVDVLAQDRFARFHIMRVERSREWHKWAATFNDRYFKSAFAFFRRVMRGSVRYCVYMDARDVPASRWERLKWALRKAADRDDEYPSGSRLVRELVPMSSKASDLLQLVDVVAGGRTAAPTGAAKLALKGRLDALGRVNQWTFDFDPARVRSRSRARRTAYR